MIKAFGTKVIVMPLTGDTDDEGRPMDGTLYLGREVKHPLGIVVSVGDQAQGLEKGDKVLWGRDLGAEFEHEGVMLSSLDTQSRCPHCHKGISSEMIYGVVEDEGSE